MLKTIPFLRRWLPAMVLMATIFTFSSIPSYELPNFAWADTFIKKGGHMLGYGLLALAYLRALHSEVSNLLCNAAIAWLLAVLYACSDEFHQFFVAGRHSSLVDVSIDALGAAIILTASIWFLQRNKKIYTPFV